MDHTEKKNQFSLTLHQTEVNWAGTFYQCGGTASRPSFLGSKYFIMMKENQSIFLCAPWLWKLLHKTQAQQCLQCFFSSLHTLLFLGGIKSNCGHMKVLYEKLRHSVSLRNEWQCKRLVIQFSGFFLWTFQKEYNKFFNKVF